MAITNKSTQQPIPEGKVQYSEVEKPSTNMSTVATVANKTSSESMGNPSGADVPESAHYYPRKTS